MAITDSEMSNPVAGQEEQITILIGNIENLRAVNNELRKTISCLKELINKAYRASQDTSELKGR